jgi:flagellar biosynthesis/type III secretory pathway M-ring protein FliF/YscJ
MNLILANAFPVAGVWVYAFMAIVALILIPIFPFILRRRRRRAQKQLHERIEKAKADILEDGVVEGPKGPYVPHNRSGVKTDLWPPHDTRPPKANAYHGMPWT